MNFWNKLKFNAKKYSPEIMIVAGTIGFIVSAILAGKETLTAKEIVEDAKKEFDDIPDDDEKETRTEKAKVVIKTAGKLALNYAPAATGILVSTGLSFGSNAILRRRNLGLAAELEAATMSYRMLRKNIRQKYGEEVDKELAFGTGKEKIEETIIDEKTGEKKKKKVTVNVSDLSEYSPYAVYFAGPNYQGDDFCDRYFVDAQSEYFTNLLRSRGFLSFNYVLEEMAIPVPEHLKAPSLVTGWRYKKDNPDGDNQVIIDMYKTYRTRPDGRIEPVTILDFNIDGDIYSSMIKDRKC